MAEEQPFGLWLKQCRKVLDLTQQELARRAGYSVQTIEKIESGARRPSKEVAERLAVCLEIPPEERAGFVQWARGGTRPSGPPPGSPRPPHNLPAPPNSFVGRDREVVQAGQLLGRAGVRLLTLTGPPGIGKTRLALEVARSVLDTFAQGVALVSLAALRDPGLVGAAIAATLGVREAAPRPLAERLYEALRDQERLLVLDNFEQILPAAALVGELLAHAPRLKVLVTSRTALRLYGEHELRLGALAVPDGRRLPTPGSDAGRLLRYAALALFVERAQAAQPDFTLAADNAGLVAALCRRLDGLPLAIELAAARIRTLPPALLLAGLSGANGPAPLRLLTGGARNVPPRQRTLRAAIAWSYDLLEAPQRQVFRRLAVFVGGCTPEAAERVVSGQWSVVSGQESGISDQGSEHQYAIRNTQHAADPQSSVLSPQSSVLAELAGLVDNNLLRQATTAGGARYQMLETIREYGLEQLAAHRELEVARQQHAHYFLALAVQGVAAFRRPEGAEWQARLELEHDNLRAALEWAGGQEDLEPALRLADALWQFWVRGGQLAEGRQRLAGLLARPATAAYPALRARVLMGAGALAWNQDDYPAAGGYWEESLLLFRQVADQPNLALALNCLGGLAYSQGDLPPARRFYEESLLHARAIGNRYLTAGLLHNLGGVALDQRDAAAAQVFEEESLALGRAFGFQEIQAFALAGLGAVAQYQGDHATAHAYYTESLAIRREMGDKVQSTELLVYLGFVAYQRGDAEQAHPLFTEGLTLALEAGIRHHTGTVLIGMGMLAAAQGQAARAALLLGAAQTQHQNLGRPVVVHIEAEYEQTLAAVRAQLAEDAFATAWATGQAMTEEQAAATALAPLSSGVPGPPRRRQRATRAGRPV